MGSVVQSDTEIVNMALDLLVEDPITDITTDDRAVARWMKRNYAHVRDALLRRHPWNFAIERTTLPELATAPAYEFTKQYELPADCIRLLPVTADGTRTGLRVTHVVEGRKLLTNKSGPLKVRYIKRISDTSLFDPSFVQALVHLLASKAALWMTGKTGIAKDLRDPTYGAMGEAQLLDSLEGTPEPIEDDDIIEMR